MIQAKPTKKYLSLATVGALLVLQQGCADPNQASKANFTKAIQKYHDEVPLCVKVPNNSLKDFPFVLETGGLFSLSPEDLGPFVEAGLITEAVEKVEKAGDPAPSWSTRARQKYTVKKHTFALTDLGRKSFRKDDRQFYSVSFCYGKLKVEEVIRYTEPAPIPMVGITGTRVEYRARQVDVAEWSKTPSLSPQIQASAKDASGDKTATLIKMSDGWHDYRLKGR
jgi:hypothetical protein